MTITDALRFGMGDPVRFKDLRERVEVLIEGQARTWTSGTSSWIVAPLQRRPSSFYLLSEDREGQRRGREVLQAFLGPATATIEDVSPQADGDEIDRALVSAGLVMLSLVRRSDAIATTTLLDRLEEAVAVARTRDSRVRPVQPSHVDILRDFRLALLQRNSRLAEQAWQDLRLTGQLSSENLRFLQIELLGHLERWRELRDLPYLAELLRARRPRAVNELLLDMLWRTEVSELHAAGQTPQEIHVTAQFDARYGSILGAVDIPTRPGGRAAAALDAIVRGDDERLRRLLEASGDDLERGLLERMVNRASGSTPPPPLPSTDEHLRTLFENRQHEHVIRAFLAAPEPGLADLAAQAVLDSENTLQGIAVLALINDWLTLGLLEPDRRLRNDLQDLTRLVNGACQDWHDWSSRLTRNERWADAAEVLRAQHTQWGSVHDLASSAVKRLADGLLTAWSGTNQDQVVSTLDILCRAAAESALFPHCAEFCDMVLLLLAEQQSLSAPVREAYLMLLDQLLQAGPPEARYQDMLEQTRVHWHNANSPAAADWGLGLIDVLLSASAPDPSVRLAVVTEVLLKIQDFHRRFSARQASEFDALAEEIDLPVRRTTEPKPQGDQLWNKLEGKVVGIYSLLPRASDALSKRISRLCAGVTVEGNADTVSTAALQALTTRADFLIVDTWHAAHAATAAIDAIRSRNQQILPRGRGITAFLQALEESLS